MRFLSLLLVLPVFSVAAVVPQKYIHIEHKPGLWNITNSSRVLRSDGLSAETNSFGVADVRPLVTENSAARAHAQVSVDQNRTASIWFWSTVPVGITARLATYPLVSWEVITPQTGWIIFGSGIALSIIGALVSLNYFNNAKFSMYLGIKEYNHPTSLAETGTAAYFGGMSFPLR